MKNIIIIISIIVIASVVFFFYFYDDFRVSEREIMNFNDCAAAGFSIMESYPRQCRANGEKLFVENIGNELEKTDLIRINNPRPNQKIESPLEISGEARGFWYFEASFPVKLLDGNGRQISTIPPYIEAKGEWMTEDFVPFLSRIEFQKPETETGTLILEKDNPSGLPENADELVVPVKF